MKLPLDFSDNYGDNRNGEGPILDRLKERFQNILNRMKKAVEDGKPMKPRFLKKAQDLFEKLKGSGGLTKKFREMFENLKSKLGKETTGDPVDDDDSDEDDEDDLFFGPILDRLKERFQTIVDRMKKAVDEGKTVRPNLLKKAQDLFDKLKSMGGISEKMKQTFEDLRSKLSRGGPVANAPNVFDVFKRLKKLILDKVDAEKLKEKVEEWFGKGSELAEQLINLLKDKGEKGKNRILDWIDRVLEDKQEEKRSVKEMWEKVKDYFKDLHIDLKEKFTKFGQWVKTQYDKGLEKGKDKLENVKRIAKEFLEDSKQISKDVAEEALEFFREYKEDLGKVFDDIKEKVKKTLKE